MNTLTSPARRPTPSLSQETGQFLICRWGSHVALGFKGEKDFIERSHAWAINTGMARGDLKWVYGVGGRIAYVTVKNRARVEAAVLAQVSAEIARSGEVPLLKDYIDDDTGAPVIEHDERAEAALAAARTAEFMGNRIEEENFLENRHVGLAPVYSLADEQWSGFKRNKRSAR